MPAAVNTPDALFTKEFLKYYLRSGMGSMSKSDIDALVMYLLDTYANESGRPLGAHPNQVASERLRTPLAKIKRLRYESGLKYGGKPEDVARTRFTQCLAKAGLEFEKTENSVAKIVFVVEDTLAKNWIQGKIKENSGVFDNSFNTEIIKVEPELFFKLLGTLLNACDIDTFKTKYENLLKQNSRENIRNEFKKLVSSLAQETAGQLVLKTLLTLPYIGS